jgi:NAD(P)-dependent dehydrogenase (short-subunit alcohol dehydrogenase family)
MVSWTEDGVPRQDGRTALVTGANTGVGFHVARVLAERGAHVLLGCRDAGRAAEAADRLRAARPGARVGVVPLDLASLASVAAAADTVRAGHDRLDLLVNNAGVMRTPDRTTADGFELQLGTNHLGHVALTGRLLGLLLATPGARVVTVSSPAHRQAPRDADPLAAPRRYSPAGAYARSKLANLLFAYELQHRLAAAGHDARSLAAHPGGARTELNRHMPAIMLARGRSWGVWRPITQPPERAALSILRAATDPAAAGGGYYRPDGLLEFRGDPEPGRSSERSYDRDLQRAVWAASERLTGVTFPLPAATPG